MDFNYSENCISIQDKVLSKLDQFTIDFTEKLENFSKYVIVSGYISILFGRNRTSEDIDIIVEKQSFQNFKSFWNYIEKDYECINSNDPNEAYHNYLLEESALRFARKNSFIPNVEFKYPKTSLDEWTLAKRKKIVLNQYILYISSLELQIPFKLFLGSEKDIEDALHLYKIFQKYINHSLFEEFIRKLNTEELFNTYLK